MRDINDVDEYNELFAKDAFVYDGTKNPFDQGTWRNCLVFWCAPRWTADATGDCGFQRVSPAWTKMVRHPSVIRLKACPWPTGQVSQKLCRFRKLADMAKKHRLKGKLCHTISYATCKRYANSLEKCGPFLELLMLCVELTTSSFFFKHEASVHRSMKGPFGQV